jgi:rod shape-determining protein MreD
MTATREKVRAVLVAAAYILGLGLLQSTVFTDLRVLGSPPDLTLVLAILAGYLFGSTDGAIIGLFTGFFRDMLAGRAIGLGMLLLMYIAILASVMFRKSFRHNILFGLVQILLLTLFYEAFITILSFAVLMLPNVSISLSELLLRQIQALPGHLSANLLAGIPLIFLLRFAGPYRRGKRRDGEEDPMVGESAWRVN